MRARRSALDMLPTGPRNSAQRRARAVAALNQCDVTQRNDADELLVSVEHRQATNLNLTHVRAHFVEILIVVAILYVGCHHVADPSLRTPAHADPADRDVAVGDHADQALVIGYRQQADAER